MLGLPASAGAPALAETGGRATSATLIQGNLLALIPITERRLNSKLLRSGGIGWCEKGKGVGGRRRTRGLEAISQQGRQLPTY